MVDVELEIGGPLSPAEIAVKAARKDLLNVQLHMRWVAAEALAEIPHEMGMEAAPRAAMALCDHLHKPAAEPSERWRASRSIGQLGEAAGNASALALARALMERRPGQIASEPYVRQGLAGSLGKLGSAARGSGSVALAKALQDDWEPHTRRKAAEALGNLGPVAAGPHGRKSLAYALRMDKVPHVRCSCAESLASMGPAAGEESSAALVKALQSDLEISVRWRAAFALGRLGNAAQDSGAIALKTARDKDRSLAVREQADQAIDHLRSSCVKILESLRTHHYMRGQAAWVMGQLGEGPTKEGVNALAMTLLRPGEDVYLRRRAVEALGRFGNGISGIGAAAICRASNEDPDVYVQWQAGEMWTKLPPEVQQAAVECEEELVRLQGEDTLKQDELKRKFAEERPLVRPAPPVVSRRQLQIDEEEQAAKAAAEEQEEQRLEEQAAAAEEQAAAAAAAASSEAVAAVEAIAEEARLEYEKIQQAERHVQAELEAEAQRVAEADRDKEDAEPPDFDEQRTLEVFRRLADQGELNRENLTEALRLFGHENVNEDWVNAVVAGALNDRAFLDQVDFRKFLMDYEARHWDYVRAKFSEADADHSGKVSASELTIVLRKAGITPITGVVHELIREVCGDKADGINFRKFAVLLGILRHRCGFTLDEYSAIQAAFARYDRDCNTEINSMGLRGCLAWVGFDLDAAAVDAAVVQATALPPTSPSSRPRTALAIQISEPEGPKEVMVSQVDVLQIVRSLRESEAKAVLAEIHKIQHEESEAVAIEDLPELLMELGLTITSPQVLREAFAELALSGVDGLTLEDIMPMLWGIRKRHGFTKDEMAEITEVFYKNDVDQSDGMSGAELERAIRSLGYPCTLDEVLDQLDEWDLDETGDLDLLEFVKLLARYRQKEMREILVALAHRGTFPPLGHGRIQKSKIRAHLSQTELAPILLACGHGPLRQDSQVLQQSSDNTFTSGIWAFTEMMAQYRAEAHLKSRANDGYTDVEMVALQEQFRKFDADNSGRVEKKELHELLHSVCPNATKTKAGHQQMAQLLKECDADNSGSIDFREFVHMMRLVSERYSREMLQKEKEAVQDTGFTIHELKEFRQVFRVYDLNGSGDLSFEELQQMIATIVKKAVGADGAASLLEIMRSVDEDGNCVLDFPEFLHVMHRLLDENWGRIVQKLSGEDPGSPTSPGAPASPISRPQS
ncbi:unnamed protein product [Polarella glacialis]|uniref:EF-hand domain-containing protein n=2 Tax=Polarella glacialis TaxID=89957 RepID=A0A813FKU3_POLGL|nr:unnamed protein product [Polarella glacialis]